MILSTIDSDLTARFPQYGKALLHRDYGQPLLYRSTEWTPRNTNPDWSKTLSHRLDKKEVRHGWPRTYGFRITVHLLFSLDYLNRKKKANRLAFCLLSHAQTPFFLRKGKLNNDLLFHALKNSKFQYLDQMNCLENNKDRVSWEYLPNIYVNLMFFLTLVSPYSSSGSFRS